MQHLDLVNMNFMSSVLLFFKSVKNLIYEHVYYIILV